MNNKNKIIQLKKHKKSVEYDVIMLKIEKNLKTRIEKQSKKFRITLEQYINLVLKMNEKDIGEIIKK